MQAKILKLQFKINDYFILKFKKALQNYRRKSTSLFGH